MIKYLQGNPSLAISALSLIIALFVLVLNRKNAKRNSYGLRACYHVFFIKRGIFARLINKYDFYVKIFNSISSEVIPFDYSLIVRPHIGGIYRSQIFSAFDTKRSFGINKTGPAILPVKPSKNPSKKYANKSEWHFSSTPLFPYFSASGNFDEDLGAFNRQLNRYHFYIEITDFCKNTEIWYMSFSLLLSNIKEHGKKWEKCIYDRAYQYYTFDDINIVSPRDIPKNLERTNNFTKSLKEIEGKTENSLKSAALVEDGFDKMNYNLQLFEMKEYIAFVKN